jgi:hypothetical protein
MTRCSQSCNLRDEIQTTMDQRRKFCKVKQQLEALLLQEPKRKDTTQDKIDYVNGKLVVLTKSILQVSERIDRGCHKCHPEVN